MGRPAERPRAEGRRARGDEDARARALREADAREAERDEADDEGEAPRDTLPDEAVPAAVRDAARAHARTLPSARRLHVDGARVMPAVRVPAADPRPAPRREVPAAPARPPRPSRRFALAVALVGLGLTLVAWLALRS